VRPPEKPHDASTGIAPKERFGSALREAPPPGKHLYEPVVEERTDRSSPRAEQPKVARDNSRGMHFDPSVRSDLENILAETEFNGASTAENLGLADASRTTFRGKP
jgi:hypothetical protein